MTLTLVIAAIAIAVLLTGLCTKPWKGPFRDPIPPIGPAR